MSAKRALQFLVVVAVVVLMVLPLSSQSANGRISGAVRDQTGGTIVGAAVIVTDLARGLARNLVTDEGGAYLAPNLLPGNYSVRVTFTGFQGWERTNILLEVGGDLAIDAILVPGAQTQTVTITEELPLVNTTSATLGGTLSNETISDLPIAGRNFRNLLDLRPGTVTNLGNDSGGGGSQLVNGLRPEMSNETLVEGLHGMEPFSGQSIVNNLALGNDAAVMMPADAIQEFSTQVNSKAEYGWKPGASVNVGIKSGTNGIHGTGFGIFRSDSLDARSYFNTAADQPEVNADLQQFGGTVGGPIKKDKLFFFLGYEQQYYTVGSSASTSAAFTDASMIANYPGCIATSNCAPIVNSVAGARTPDASNHLILACLGLPAASRSPQSLSMVSLNPDCSTGANYPNSVNGTTWLVPHGGNDHGATANPAFGINSYIPNTQTNNRSIGSVAKVDYQLNEKNSVNAFVFTGAGNNRGGTNQALPEFRTQVTLSPLMVAGTWTSLPNSAWANSFRIGYAKLVVYFRGLDVVEGRTAAQLGLPTGVTQFPEYNAGYPQSLTITGLNVIGSRNSEVRAPHSSFEISDQVNYLVGRHSIRFGGAIMPVQQNGGTWSNTKGTFTFGQGASGSSNASGLVAFLAGQNAVPATVLGTPIRSATTGLESASLFYGNPESHIRRGSYALFFQDDFRIRPRLTLNLGVRYELNTVVHDVNSILGSFDPNIGLIQEGIQRARVYNGDHNNFAPRIGFAWDVLGNGTTVVKAGGSVIYDLMTLATFSEVGNAPGLAANQTAWVIGCSAPVVALAVGANTNCPGTLLTSGGTRDVGQVSWSRSVGTIIGNSAACAPASNCGPLVWDTPATIYPASAIHNCSPSILIRDTPTSPGRAGARCPIVAVDPALATPYVATWTLSVQRAIARNFVLEVAYVGNRGIKFIGRTDDNQPPQGLWNTVVSGATGTNAGNNGRTLASLCEQFKDQTNCNAGSLGNGTAPNLTNSLATYTNALNAGKPFAVKFPYIESITRVWNAHWSTYHGLQTTLTARNFHGVSILSGYTWSKALDVASTSGSGVGTDSYNVGLDYGRAAGDLRHRFTLSATYALPGRMGYAGLLSGWKLNGVYRFQTGRSWNPAATGDFQGTGRTTRWDFFGDGSDFTVDYTGSNKAIFHPAGVAASGTNPQTGLAYTTAELAVNTPACALHAASLATLQAFGCWTQGSSAITPPAIGTFGNLAKGLFDGPGYWAVDMSAAKTQHITERFSAEFRAESFNIFNHPAFAQPATGLGCSSSTCNLGLTSNTPNVQARNALLGTGGPRRFQLGVKLIF